ncbi:hypothetical protein H310_08134 [Aphanomyces invadans]|uniref:F-box domain-containing protein n=1 Tax=Aphanomyces invadans TaxID=157072 RepID=A0A024TZM7_9STRA|nr:hypothetical protein H310_08134 [Aphanomyces invadans]ETV99443.1 hypothetical protein H310_08134 [Aphanomyces invadans]|eukprot:XP_008871999.1 hypothetical protein H310_08134 [Aphanomyces invadans]
MNHAGGTMNSGADNEPIWDEDLTELLNSPEQGTSQWHVASTTTGVPGPTRCDIGRLSSFDLAEIHHSDVASTTQLDISYERKKSRAKITRVEVNNGFDDLLQVLRLPNSRKNSRAKVIQYACERIRALEQENERLKQQLPLPGALPPATAGAMVWIPCTSMLLPQISQPQQTRVLQKAKRAKKTIKSVAAAQSATPSTTPSMLHALVTTCPHVLRYLDAVSLARLMQVSSEWNAYLGHVKQGYLWGALVTARWRIDGAALTTVEPGLTMRDKWLQLHHTMTLPRLVYALNASQSMPDCSEVGPTSAAGSQLGIVAKGRAPGVDMWGILARRSNSRTTRSVWRDGAVSVMQVVEVHIVVQNTHGIAPMTVTLVDVAPFKVLDASYGTLFEPRWIARNGVKIEVAMPDLVLKHLDVGVLSVYVSCPHVEFEHEFLSRAHSIRVVCATRGALSVQRLRVVEAPFVRGVPQHPLVRTADRMHDK